MRILFSILALVFFSVNSYSFEELKQDTTNSKISPDKRVEFTIDSLSKDNKLNFEDQYIEKIAQYLKNNPKLIVCIESHTDNKGKNAEERLKISQRRIDNAVNYLTSKGVPKNRIFSVPMGNLNPKYNNSRDNRIEIYFK